MKLDVDPAVVGGLDDGDDPHQALRNELLAASVRKILEGCYLELWRLAFDALRLCRRDGHIAETNEGFAERSILEGYGLELGLDGVDSLEYGSILIVKVYQFIAKCCSS